MKRLLYVRISSNNIPKRPSMSHSVRTVVSCFPPRFPISSSTPLSNSTYLHSCLTLDRSIPGSCPYSPATHWSPNDLFEAWNFLFSPGTAVVPWKAMYRTSCVECLTSPLEASSPKQSFQGKAPLPPWCYLTYRPKYHNADMSQSATRGEVDSQMHEARIFVSHITAVLLSWRIHGTQLAPQLVDNPYESMMRAHLGSRMFIAGAIIPAHDVDDPFI